MGQERARRRAWMGVLAGAVLVAGCSGGDATGSASPSASAAVTAAVTETAAASASPAASATQSAAASPAPSPAPSASTSASASAPASEEARVVLDADGLGIAGFGDGPEDVIAALDGRYGSPTEDSGWVGAGNFGVCPGSTTRGVRYGQLLALMSDGPSDYAQAGQRHLFGYSVSAQTDDPAAEYGDGPQTADAIGVGSTVADLRAAFGEGLEVREGDELLGPNFVVTSEGTIQEFVFTGALTDLTDAGLVTVFSAGQQCGE